MAIVADTHLHLYSCYDLQAAIRHLIANLSRLGHEAVRVIDRLDVIVTEPTPQPRHDRLEGVERRGRGVILQTAKATLSIGTA